MLVVDDEEPLVRLAIETLESLGYKPIGFTSSLNALQEFRDAPERFDAILTDERMPGVTGLTIIREVRAHQRLDPDPADDRLRRRRRHGARESSARTTC